MQNQPKEINLKTNLNPYIYLSDSISFFSVKLLVLIFVQILMLIITKSYSALGVISTSFLGGLCAASLYYLIYKEPLYNSLVILTQSLFIGFLLPSTFPLVTVFFISFFTLFVFKLFLYQSNPWINPAALAVLIGWFIGRNYFPDFLMNSDLAFSKNPGAILISQGSFPIHSFDSVVTGFLNNYIFSLFKVTIPEGFVSLLWDSGSIIPAFRFNLITIISSIFVFSDDVSRILIPYIFLFVYGILVRLFVPLIFGGQFNSGDIILAYLTSGTLFCVVFMFQYFGTVPITTPSRILYGVLSGVLAFLITGCGTSPIGMVYTILVCNLINLPLRYLEDKRVNYLYFKKFRTSSDKVKEQ